MFNWLKKKVRVDTCAYCGEYTQIKKYYGGYGEYDFMMGSACCYKCDLANHIKWKEESRKELIKKKKGLPNRNQLKWKKQRDKILKKNENRIRKST